VKYTGDKHTNDDYPDVVALAAQYFAQTVALIKPLSAEQFPFLKVMDMMGSPLAQAIVSPESQRPAHYDMIDYF
jgi:hypothetical protein